MHIRKLIELFGKLLLGLMVFPPILIVFKYLRWCGKAEKNCEMSNEES